MWPCLRRMTCLVASIRFVQACMNSDNFAFSVVVIHFHVDCGRDCIRGDYCKQTYKGPSKKMIQRYTCWRLFLRRPSVQILPREGTCLVETLDFRSSFFNPDFLNASVFMLSIELPSSTKHHSTSSLCMAATTTSRNISLEPPHTFSSSLKLRMGLFLQCWPTAW